MDTLDQQDVAREFIHKLSSILPAKSYKILGGAPRDWYFGAPCKDLDVFLFGKLGEDIKQQLKDLIGIAAKKKKKTTKSIFTDLPEFVGAAKEWMAYLRYVVEDEELGKVDLTQEVWDQESMALNLDTCIAIFSVLEEENSAKELKELSASVLEQKKLKFSTKENLKRFEEEFLPLLEQGRSFKETEKIWKDALKYSTLVKSKKEYPVSEVIKGEYKGLAIDFIIRKEKSLEKVFDTFYSSLCEVEALFNADGSISYAGSPAFEETVQSRVVFYPPRLDARAKEKVAQLKESFPDFDHGD